MRYYQSTERVEVTGTFITYAYGYYSFELEDGEVLSFDEVKKTVVEKYDLKSDHFNGQKFKIYYSIIIDDMDDEDFVILRLDDLQIK